MGENTVFTATGFDACFCHTFYRPAFTLHGHVFYVTGARCRDFVWTHVSPPHTRPPCRCAHRWCVDIRPVRFPVVNPRAPPPTTIPDWLCVCAPMPMCISLPIWVWQRVCAENLETAGDESQRWEKESPEHPACDGDVVAHTMRCRGWTQESPFPILQIWSFTLFGDFIFVDFSALEIRGRSALSFPNGAIHFQSPLNQPNITGQKNAHSEPWDTEIWMIA